MLRCWLIFLLFCFTNSFSQSREDLYKAYFFEKDSVQKKVNGENFVRKSLEDASTLQSSARFSVLMKAELVRKKIYPRGVDMPTLLAFDTLLAQMNKQAFRLPYLMQALQIQQSLGDSTYCRELHLKLMRINLLMQNSKLAFYHQTAYYRLLKFQWTKDLTFNGEKSDSLQKAIQKHADSLNFAQEQEKIEWMKKVQTKNSKVILILVSTAVLIIALLLFLLRFRKPKTQIQVQEKVVYQEKEVIQEVIKEIVKETKEDDYLLQQLNRAKRNELNLLEGFFKQVFYHSSGNDRLIYFVNEFVAGKKQVVLFHYTHAYSGKDKLLLEQFLDAFLLKQVKEHRIKDSAEILLQCNVHINSLQLFPEQKEGLKIAAFSLALQPYENRFLCTQIQWCGAGAGLAFKNKEGIHKLEPKIALLGNGQNVSKLSLYEIKPEENFTLFSYFTQADEKFMQEIFAGNAWDEKNKALTFLKASATDSMLAVNF